MGSGFDGEKDAFPRSAEEREDVVEVRNHPKPQAPHKEPPTLLVTSRSLTTTRKTRRALGRKLPEARIRGSGFQGIYLVDAEGDPLELAQKVYRECRRSIGRATAAVAEVRSELSFIKEGALRAATEHVRSGEKFCFRLNKRGSHFLDKETPTLEYEVGGAIWVALRERDRVEPKVDLSDPDVTIVADVLGPVTVIGIQRKAWAQGAPRFEKRSVPPKLGSSEAPQQLSYMKIQEARPITESGFQEALDATRQEGIWRLDPGVGARFGRKGRLV